MMNQYAPEKSKNVLPLAPSLGDKKSESDVDRSGEAILRRLQEAANLAEANCESAMDAARELSEQIRAAESREKELQSEIRHYRDRASRAEEWLLRIYKELEEKFFGKNAVGAAQIRRRNQGD